jgi:hypothetical protein
LSYDITMFRIPEGADPASAYQEIVEQEEPASDDESIALMECIAAALKSWNPSLRESRSALPLTWIELDQSSLSAQIIVNHQTVSINLPYFRDKAPEMMSLLVGCIETVHKAADYSAFDPQLGRLVTPADLREMTALYRGVDRAQPQLRAPSRKPWWKLW